MDWFEGEISAAIQKAIGEKKLFIVFVKDDGEQSQTMNDLWEIDEVKVICTDDVCVAINLTVGSLECEQFGKIYPILCVPAVFFINNDGIPSAILPYTEKDEFVSKLKSIFQEFKDNLAGSSSTQAMDPQASDVNNANEAAVNQEKDEDATATSVNESESENQTVESVSKKEKAEALLEKSRASKAEKEKEEVKEKERKRREEGRELSQAKRDLAERQAKQLADDIAKQRAEEKAARERVREQIKQDRLDKVARYEAEKKAKEQVQNEKLVAKKEAEKSSQREKSDSNTSRIQFRLPDGSTALKEFPADAKFLIVNTHALSLVPHLSNMRLTTVYPKHEYTSEDCLKSIRELGLTPSASIIVSPGAASTSSSSTFSLNPFNIISMVLAPIFAILSWFFSLFTSSSNEAPTTQNVGLQETTPNQTNQQIRDAALRRRNIDGTGSNIRRLHDDKPDDDDNATWNGNSTQQM